MVGVRGLKRFVQIYNKKAHWIFEAEVQPVFAPDIVIKDITNKPDIKEGWDYDEVFDAFTAPVIPEPVEPEPSIEEMQAQTLLNTEYLVIMSELTNL